MGVNEVMSEPATISETSSGIAPIRKVVDIKEANPFLEKKTAEERVAWALERFGEKAVMGSSFGAQSAVMLHLVTTQMPRIPVILVDTGYLFPETYRFVDELTERLSLNLRVYRPRLSAAWQEARYGKLWEKGLEGLEQYGRMNKDEPMQRALEELDAEAWLVGLRRSQGSSRKKLNPLAVQNGIVKVHPIIDWTDRDIFEYLKKHGLPYHPLWEEGYVSIGDVQTTRRLTDGLTEEETRFFGMKRECGLHDDAQPDYSI